jgi:hypothetical protein
VQRIVIGGNLRVIAPLVIRRSRSLDSGSRWLVGEDDLTRCHADQQPLVCLRLLASRVRAL